MRTIEQAISWLQQPGIKAIMPQDPHTQMAISILIEHTKKSKIEKEQIVKALEEKK